MIALIDRDRLLRDARCTSSVAAFVLGGLLLGGCSGSIEPGGSSGSAAGSTGTTGSTAGSTTGSTGGTTGATGSATGATTGSGASSGNTGTTGYTGSGIGVSGDIYIGTTGSITGTTGFSGFTGATGTSGSGTGGCSGSGCGGVTGTTSGSAEPPPPQCNFPLPQICELCSNGETVCAHYAIQNGQCVTEICPNAPVSCVQNAVCTPGTQCGSVTPDGCSSSCFCDVAGMMQCSSSCPGSAPDAGPGQCNVVPPPICEACEDGGVSCASYATVNGVCELIRTPCGTPVPAVDAATLAPPVFEAGLAE